MEEAKVWGLFHFGELGLQVTGQKGNNFKITGNRRQEILVLVKSHNAFWWTPFDEPQQ